MYKINKGKNVAMAIIAATAMTGGAAFAQTSTGYSSILSGLDTSTAVGAVIAAGALLASVGFAKWATKKVARFFG